MVARSDSADRSFSRKRASRSAGIASSRRPGSSASRSVSKGFEASFGIPAARRSAKAAPRRSAAALPPQASRRSAAREKNDIRLALCVGADGPSAGTAHAGAVCDYSRRIADGAVTEKGLNQLKQIYSYITTYYQNEQIHRHLRSCENAWCFHYYPPPMGCGREVESEPRTFWTSSV